MPGGLFGAGGSKGNYRCGILLGFVVVTVTLELLFFSFGPPPVAECEQLEAAEQFTVVLNTFKAEHLLRASVLQYSQCRVVNRIHVVWAESLTPPDLQASTCCRVPVTFALPLATVNDSSLNVRFLPVPGIETEAVLSIDDDIILTCAGLERAFRQWRAHPDNLVGWFPRAFATQRDGSHSYRTKAQTLLLDRSYAIALTKAAFLHHRFLELYSAGMPPAITAMVREWRNCEDIAMQFLVSNATGTRPWFVWDSMIIDKGAGLWNGKRISSGHDHVAQRGRCIDKLTEYFPAARVQAQPLTAHGWFTSWALWLSPIVDALTITTGRVASSQCGKGSYAQQTWSRRVLTRRVDDA